MTFIIISCFVTLWNKNCFKQDFLAILDGTFSSDVYNISEDRYVQHRHRELMTQVVRAVEVETRRLLYNNVQFPQEENKVNFLDTFHCKYLRHSDTSW